MRFRKGSVTYLKIEKPQNVTYWKNVKRQNVTLDLKPDTHKKLSGSVPADSERP